MPQQQLVEIARAVALDARVIIFDEPTASLSEEEHGISSLLSASFERGASE